MGAIAFYVSGHGFGHAMRVGAVLGELMEMEGAPEVHVRTTAPAGLFPRHEKVKVWGEGIDFRMVESADTLAIDVAGTVGELEGLLERRAEVVAREVAFVKAAGVGAIYADIPFLVGDVGEAAGVASVGVSNFTWNWILQEAPGRLVAAMEESYGRFRALWQLPFGQREGLGCFREVRQFPLVVRRGVKDVAVAGEQQRVLVAVRGTLEVKDVEGFRLVRPGVDGEFGELLAGAAMVIGKLGYGLVAECCAGRKPLLYAGRRGFVEDGITSVEGRRYIPMMEVGGEALRSGEWGAAARELLGMEMPPARVDASGAAAVARAMMERGF